MELKVDSTHRKIRNVFKSKKSKDMPSTPKVKLKFKIEIQDNWNKNWNDPVFFSKKSQSKRDVKKDKALLDKAIKKLLFDTLFLTKLEKISISSIPIRGKHKRSTIK